MRLGDSFRTNGLEDQMLKRQSSLLRVVCALFFFAATTGVMASPVGTWKTIDDETGKAKSYVQVYEYQGKYYGKVVKLINPSEPNPKCDKCTGAYKDKPIVGMTIMWGLSKEGNEYSGGQILDPAKGKVYNCKIWVEGGALKVRGYIGPFFRTQTWYKVN